METVLAGVIERSEGDGSASRSRAGASCGFRLSSYVTPEAFTTLKLAPSKDVFASFRTTAIHVIPRDAEPSGATVARGDGPVPPRARAADGRGGE